MMICTSKTGKFLQRLTRWWAVALLVVLTLSCLGVTERATAAGPWKGQIVDKETGKPLEGVVVLATWYKAYSTHGGWGGAGYHDSEEGRDGHERWIYDSVKTNVDDKSVQHHQRPGILYIQTWVWAMAV